jgi:hypothetical protein
MQWRTDNQVPPGYKDASKDDKGIGDFLIWKSILDLGKKKNRDLVHRFFKTDHKRRIPIC